MLIQSLYMNIQNRFFCNSSEPETARMSINSWTDKEIVVYTCSRIWLSNKNELLLNTKTWMNLKIIMPSHSVTNSTYHMISFPEISRRCKLIDGNSRPMVPWEWWGWTGRGRSVGLQRILGNLEGDGYVHYLDVLLSRCIHM